MAVTDTAVDAYAAAVGFVGETAQPLPPAGVLVIIAAAAAAAVTLVRWRWFGARYFIVYVHEAGHAAVAPPPSTS